MLDFFTALFNVLRGYVNFLFTLQIAPGVSVGSFLLFATILTIIVKSFWVRS